MIEIVKGSCMRRKKYSTIIILLISISFIIGIIVTLPKAMNEMKVNNINQQISMNEIFNKKGKFYVYFYKNDCPYCINIDDDIKKFNNDNTVFYLNIDEAEEKMGVYDWNKHKVKFDVEIGEKVEATIKFTDGLNEDTIEKKYPFENYMIKLADQKYAQFYQGIEVNKIYAVSTHPQLSENDLEENNFVIPGVPLLVEFSNHKAVKYYFDDKEIIRFLNSNTIPLDSYWNLK